MQVAYDYRHLANVSAKCKRLSAVWRTSPRNARAFPPFGERLREMQEPFHHLANVSCNLRETFVPLRTISCNLRETFVPLRTISCNLRETIVPLHTISCNLRETFVPLQTSPAICGRPSYPYKHLLQSAGDLRTPTNISCNLRETIVPLRKSASAFFSLMICASYRKPYFCFIKIQYPEEIIRKYTQLSR